MVLKSREQFKVYENVFDEFTINNLTSLISKNVIDGLESSICLGKEANIFSAKRGENNVIVKIYRVQSCNFNKIYEYISQDPRFNAMKNRRKLILEWVKREFRNLKIAKKCQINVPMPYIVHQNIIVMEMIGDEEVAPQLKDRTPKNPQEFFDKTIAMVEKLLLDAQIVHGDLSKFNILNFNEEPYFIDFSQGTSILAGSFLELLQRDLKNICNYFKKNNVDCNETEIFEKIRKKAITKFQST